MRIQIHGWQGPTLAAIAVMFCGAAEAADLPAPANDGYSAPIAAPAAAPGPRLQRRCHRPIIWFLPNCDQVTIELFNSHGPASPGAPQAARSAPAAAAASSAAPAAAPSAAPSAPAAGPPSNQPGPGAGGDTPGDGGDTPGDGDGSTDPGTPDGKDCNPGQTRTHTQHHNGDRDGGRRGGAANGHGRR